MGDEILFNARRDNNGLGIPVKELVEALEKSVK
jgi:hypothetical protein